MGQSTSEQEVQGQEVQGHSPKVGFINLLLNRKCVYWSSQKTALKKYLCMVLSSNTKENDNSRSFLVSLHKMT